jgi:putative membrane protein
MTGKSIGVVFLLGLILPLMVYGQEQSVQQIVADIEREQGVESIEAIDPNMVSDAELEALGEALMSVMVPNERQHEYMDRMMGGEGSESLEAMHRSMGYSYLAEGGRGSWGPGSWRRGWPGMMGLGGWGPGMTEGPGAWRGMHGWGLMGGGWIWVLVAVLAAAVVVLIVLLATRGRRGHASGRFSGSARDILAERYARGEISRDEYRQTLDDIG